VNSNRILVLTGPTAAGKTDLSVRLAERLDAEIVGMDSMTLYRGMDIGTAKPDAQQRRRVPHHLLDVLDPWEAASVAWWLARARACCAEIQARGKRVLFVGGTPLYLKALLHGLFAGPPADAALRQRLEREAETHGRAALHQRLAAHDPATAARLHPNDLRRVVRALEVLELTGQPISAWQQQWPQGSGGRSQEPGVSNQEPGARSQQSAVSSQQSAVRSQEAGTPYSVLSTDSCSLTPDSCSLTPDSCSLPPDSGSLTPDCLWLDRPRAELYARINARVEEQIAAGLIDEVRALRALPRPISKEAAQGLGYKELFAYLDGQATLAATIERLQTRTRNFAKRQITWFRHLPECRAVSVELTFQLWAS